MMLCPDDVQVSAVIALMLLYFTDIFVEVFVSAPGERNHGHLTLQILSVFFGTSPESSRELLGEVCTGKSKPHHCSLQRRRRVVVPGVLMSTLSL